MFFCIISGKLRVQNMSEAEKSEPVQHGRNGRCYWWFSGGIIAGMVVGAVGAWQAGKLYVPPEERGLKLYKSGELDKAADLLRDAAEDGNNEAQYCLADCLIKKGGSSTQEGLQWLRTAAEHGSSDVKTQLAKLLLEGENAEQNTAEAAKWLRAAVTESHHGEAALLLCNLLEQGKVAAEYDGELIDCMNVAARSGQAEVQLELGKRYRDGNGVEEDPITALH